MRIQKLSSLVMLLLLLTAAGNIQAMDIVVTDLSGTKHEVTNAGIGGHGPFSIDLILQTNPRQWLSIQAHNIKKAVFKRIKNKKDVDVTVFLIDGTQYSGVSTQQDKLIWGKGVLQSEIKVFMNELSEIEYVQAEKRSSFSMQANKNRKWLITDGETKIESSELAIIDHYLTNKDYNRNIVYQDKFIRTEWWWPRSDEDKIPLTNGNIRIWVPVESIAYLEITGKEIDNKPEVLVRMRDGRETKMTMGLTVKIFNDETTFGMYEEDDYYTWPDSDFGRRAVSFNPLRKITFERIK